MFSESHNLDRPDPVGSHQYINLFNEAGHDCTWLGPAISPFHLFKPDQSNRKRYQVWRKKGQIYDGIKWFVPFTLLFYYNLPLLNSLYIGRNQFRFAYPALIKQLKTYGGETSFDLLWCSGPVSYSILDLLPHRLSCYRLADRLDQFSRIPANVADLQKDLIAKVDFVIVTSRALMDWAKDIRQDDVFYLPNGVNRVFFEEKKEKPVDFPDDGRPVAVFAGTLDSRFDPDLLVNAVMNRKEVHFLLIGPVTHRPLKPVLRELQEKDNLTYLGLKNYEELPGYLKWSDIGLIPFYVNKLTEAVNPIKYYEYLACGLPVIAPPMRDLVEMKGPISIYHSSDQFLDLLDSSLQVDQVEKKHYVKFASEHTWDKRYRDIVKIINEKLKSRQ